MDQRLQEMLDHYEIRKVLATYCHGVDRMDESRMASVYARESWEEHGGGTQCSGPQFSKVVMDRMRNGPFVTGNHMLGQTLVKIDGDTAGAETYFITVAQRRGDDGDMIHQMGGRYVDTLVREEGQWKITQRTCVRDWSFSIPLTSDLFGKYGFVQGQFSNEDPSFAALGIRHSGNSGGE